jgi:rod shape-determining protein MreC
MRLLFLLLWRNNFTLLFLALLSFCFYLMVQNSYFQKASVLNASNAVVARTMQGVNYVREYINLKASNEQLARENASLQNRLKESMYTGIHTRDTVRDTLHMQQYTFFKARVINNSVNRRNNYLTLDIGSLQGIKPEMGVITSQGIVGIVKQVSPHFCTVMSFLHKDTRISAKFKKSEFFGSLVWEGENPRYATLKEIDKTVPVKKGDTIVTTSFSSIYPSGLMLGVVTDSEVESGSNFHHIKVRLSVSFQNLSYVYIINHLLKNEQRSLEEASTKDDN